VRAQGSAPRGILSHQAVDKSLLILIHLSSSGSGKLTALVLSCRVGRHQVLAVAVRGPQAQLPPAVPAVGPAAPGLCAREPQPLRPPRLHHRQGPRPRHDVLCPPRAKAVVRGPRCVTHARPLQMIPLPQPRFRLRKDVLCTGHVWTHEVSRLWFIITHPDHNKRLTDHHVVSPPHRLQARDRVQLVGYRRGDEGGGRARAADPHHVHAGAALVRDPSRPPPF
jgi:hypothetical protein